MGNDWLDCGTADRFKNYVCEALNLTDRQLAPDSLRLSNCECIVHSFIPDRRKVGHPERPSRPARFWRTLFAKCRWFRESIGQPDSKTGDGETQMFTLDPFRHRHVICPVHSSPVFVK